MMLKGRSLVTLIILLLFSLSVYAIIDIPPVISIQGPSDPESAATIIATGVDSLDNAGLDWVKIYENGVLHHTEDCAGATLCLATKVFIHGTTDTHSYYAIAQDIAGQQKQSETIQITYSGADGDSAFTACSALGYTWFNVVTAGSNGQCCGDDLADDDFYYYIGTTCQYCNDGATANQTVIANGNTTVTDCYYGAGCASTGSTTQLDNTYATCNQNGASSGTTCYFGAQTNTCGAAGWTCTDGAADTTYDTTCYTTGESQGTRCFTGAQTDACTANVGWTCTNGTSTTTVDNSCVGGGTNTSTTCYYGAANTTASCDASGWHCTNGTADNTMADCFTLGESQGTRCFTGLQTNYCNSTIGWTCSNGTSTTTLNTSCTGNGTIVAGVCYYGNTNTTSACSAAGWACQNGTNVNCDTSDNINLTYFADYETNTTTCTAAAISKNAADACYINTTLTCNSTTICTNSSYQSTTYYCFNNGTYYLSTTNTPPTEIADGLNNDCDAQTDEGFGAPSIISVGAPTIVNEGSTLILNFTGNDPDGNNTLSYYIYRNGTLVNNSNNYTWYPNYQNSGWYNFTFFLNDTTGLFARTNRTIQINNTPYILINEFVTDPQTNWGGTGSITTIDEYFELFNPTTTNVDITGWNLTLMDGTNTSEILNGVIPAFGYRTILNPAGAAESQNNDGQVLLYNGNVLIDSITHGTWNDGNVGDNAPDSNANDINDECLARTQETDTDNVDWRKQKCSFNISNTADVSPPNVSLILPANGSVFSNNPITFSYNVSDNKVAVINCTFFHNGTGIFTANTSQRTANRQSNSTTFTLPQGHYVWNVFCNDTNNTAWSTNRTLIFNVNDAPVINHSILNISFNEDMYNDTLNLSDWVSDPDHNDTQLVWNYSDNGNITINILANKLINFTATKNWSGSKLINLTVKDPLNLTDNHTINITVRPVNDAPINTTQIPIQRWNINTTNYINLSQYFTEVDLTDDMNWTVISAPANITIAINNNTEIANLTPHEYWSGTQYVQFRAYDSAGLFANSNNVTLVVTNQSNRVINSSINGTYYAGDNNYTNISNMLDSIINLSNITGPNWNIANSIIFNSTILNNANINNCNISDSVFGGNCNNAVIDPTYIDPSSKVDASTVLNSNVVNNSVVNQSTLDNAQVNNSNITNSIINSTTVFNATITNSNLTNSFVNGVNITNSNISNSNLTNTTIVNAIIADGIITSGNITMPNGQIYNANTQGPNVLINVTNFAPTALFTANVNQRTVTFTDLTTDPNVGGRLNDSLTYNWTMGDGTFNSSNVTFTYLYPADQTYTVNLTVTDLYGGLDTYSLQITTSTTAPPGNGGGSSSSSSSSSSSTSSSGITYIVDIPIEKALRVKDRFMFAIKGVYHYITLNKIDANSVDLTVQSTPINVTVDLLDTETVDVTNDSIADLAITLTELNSTHAVLNVSSSDEPIVLKEKQTKKTKKTAKTTKKSEIQLPSDWVRIDKPQEEEEIIEEKELVISKLNNYIRSLASRLLNILKIPKTRYVLAVLAVVFIFAIIVFIALNHHPHYAKNEKKKSTNKTVKKSTKKKSKK